MATPTKKLTFDDDVLKVLQAMRFEENDGKIVGFITSGQLERKLYLRVNKALDVLEGKWNRKLGGHIFKVDPREQLGIIVDEGELTIDVLGFFETPELVADKMYRHVGLTTGVILEPSAGEGAIVDFLIRHGYEQKNIICVEKDPGRAATLRQKGYYVMELDFMNTYPDVNGRGMFSAIYMNPPFENQQDIDHVLHAYKLLYPGKRMASVMMESAFFRDNRKSENFRAFLEEHGYSFKLPDDTFTVKTRIVVLNKDK